MLLSDKKSFTHSASESGSTSEGLEFAFKGIQDQSKVMGSLTLRKKEEVKKSPRPFKFEQQ